MFNWLRRHVPTREQIHGYRWLRWLGPRLHHPHLWHWSRRGVALGVALGLFFGLLIPVGQIPLAATLAVLVRANLPAAVTSTLITNPVTFGPIYYGAYQLGAWVMGGPAVADALPATPAPEATQGVLEWFAAMGKPLFLGLAILAVLCALLAYTLIHLGWRLWNWRRRGPPRSS